MQSIQTRRIVPALAVLTLLLSAPAEAADSPESERRRPMPPPEALAACESRESGAECSFSTDKGAVTGTCWAPQGKPLACKPAGDPPEGASPQSNR